MPEFATIQVHKETKDRIAALKRPGETYDAILTRMAEHAIAEEEVAFFAELDAMYADNANIVPLDDLWPTA